MAKGENKPVIVEVNGSDVTNVWNAGENGWLIIWQGTSFGGADQEERQIAPSPDGRHSGCQVEAAGLFDRLRPVLRSLSSDTVNKTETLWVITEADPSTATLLFPGEY